VTRCFQLNMMVPLIVCSFLLGYFVLSAFAQPPCSGGNCWACCSSPGTQSCEIQYDMYAICYCNSALAPFDNDYPGSSLCTTCTSLGCAAGNTLSCASYYCACLNDWSGRYCATCDQTTYGPHATDDTACTYRCNNHCRVGAYSSCSTSGGCTCLTNFYGPICQYDCTTHCNGHPYSASSCTVDNSGYSTTHGCQCEYGWRRGSEASEPWKYDSVNIDAVTVNGQRVAYICQENLWHMYCNLANTAYGWDIPYGWGDPATDYSCMCKAGYCGKNCSLPVVSSIDGLTCLCNGQGTWDSSAQACRCEAGFSGENCTKWTSETCPTNTQPTRVIDLPRRGVEIYTGLPVPTGSGETMYCYHVLAYNHTTGKCTRGYYWDAISEPLPYETGDFLWHWMRRIVYEMTNHVTVLTKAQSQALYTELGPYPVGPFTGDALTETAMHTLCDRYYRADMCGNRGDPNRIISANQVFSRGTIVNCAHTIDTGHDIFYCLWLLVHNAEWPYLSGYYDMATKTCFAALASESGYCHILGRMSFFYNSYYAFSRYDIQYYDPDPSLQSLGTLRFPSYRPAWYPINHDGCEFLQRASVSGQARCVPDRSLTYDYASNLDIEPRLQRIWYRESNDNASTYHQRISEVFNHTFAANQIQACLDAGGGGKCWSLVNVYIRYCQNWGTGDSSAFCRSVRPLAKNSLFIPYRTVSGLGETALIQGVGPLNCTHSVVSGHYGGAKMVRQPNLSYNCYLYSTLNSASIAVSGTETSYVWRVLDTDLTNDYGFVTL
jgi:hypothetical protein